MKFYLVLEGDSVCTIAKKFNTTCQEIIKLNDLTNVDFIKPGDVLRVK